MLKYIAYLKKIDFFYSIMSCSLIYNYLAKFPATFKGSQVNENGGA